MKKKMIWSALVLVVLFVVAAPLGFLYILNYGNPYTNVLADSIVPKYLEEKGYAKNDIEELHYVEPKHIINKDFYHGHYMVIFKDEPDMTYYYGIHKKGEQVKQFCEKDRLASNGVTETIERETKHSEEKCVNSLDNRE